MEKPDTGITSRWVGKINSDLDALVIFAAMPATGGIARPFGAHFGVCSVEEEYRGGSTSKKIESRDYLGGVPEARPIGSIHFHCHVDGQHNPRSRAKMSQPRILELVKVSSHSTAQESWR